ncbi:DUF262 domain-containing protein, partial [Shewanella sp. SG44-6]|uniref:DUF262 domain-containing protein n=1 Tax=Shewanella sp. SG44-6 TaxID=2760959 RepID=UPI0015FFBF1F
MKQVEEIFKPSTKDLFSIFSESGVVFQIPSYQRNYAWGTSELQRLLKDIEQGYERYDIKSDYQVLCFLGSIITVNISDKIDTVSSPLNIVDGQQRLTSTLFLIQCLNLSIKKIFEKNLSIPDSIFTWIADEMQEINQNTLECLFSRKKRENKACEYLPKIVREGVDLLSFRENKFKYDSPVSNYLHQYAVSVVNNIEFFSWEKHDCKAEFLSLEVVLKTFEDSFNDENFLQMTEKQLYELLDNENRFYSLKDF